MVSVHVALKKVMESDINKQWLLIAKISNSYSLEGGSENAKPQYDI